MHATLTLPARLHRLLRRHTPAFTAEHALPAAMPARTPPQATTAPPAWKANILAAQRALLSAHASTLTLRERQLALPTGSTLNMVIATSRAAPPRDALVLLHGWGAGLGMYAAALPLVAARFGSVYLVDLPGMGASSRAGPGRRASVEEGLGYFLRELDGMVAALEGEEGFVGKRFLAAHSLGGYLVARWLLERQRRGVGGGFDGVVLVSPVGVPRRVGEGGRGVLARLWRMGVTPQDGVRVLPGGVGRWLCRGYVGRRFSSGLGKEERERLADYWWRVSSAPAGGERAVGWLLEPGAWAKEPLEGRLEALRGRVCFVYGERDWMDWRAGEGVRRAMQGPTRMFRVEGADHNVFVDNPAGFADALIEACFGEVAE